MTISDFIYQHKSLQLRLLIFHGVDVEGNLVLTSPIQSHIKQKNAYVTMSKGLKLFRKSMIVNKVISADTGFP